MKGLSKYIGYVLIYGMALLVLLGLNSGQGEAFGVIGGLKFPTVSAGADIIGLSWWLWLWMPLLFVGGYSVYAHLRMRVFTLPRYGKINRWCQNLWLHLAAQLILYMVLLGGSIYLFFKEIPTSLLGTCLLLMGVHGIFLMCLMVLLIMMSGRLNLSVLGILFVEIFGYILGMEMKLSPMVNPTNWGMLVLSSNYMQGGFDIGAALFIETLISLTIIVGMPGIIRFFLIGRSGRKEVL